MQSRTLKTSTTTMILNQIGSRSARASHVLGGLLSLLFPQITMAARAISQPAPQTDIIYFYDPSRSSLYQLIVEKMSPMNAILIQVREGLCGADVSGNFPLVNYDKIGEWGVHNAASLLRAVNDQVQEQFENCVKVKLDQYAAEEEAVKNTVLIIVGIIFLAAVVIGLTFVATCCFDDYLHRKKLQNEIEKNQKARLETNKLLAAMEEGKSTPRYGSIS